MLLYHGSTLYKGTTADSVLQTWNAAGKTTFLYNIYKRYHAEAIENDFQNIEEILAGTLQ